jgi:hypothetical protein
MSSTPSSPLAVTVFFWHFIAVRVPRYTRPSPHQDERFKMKETLLKRRETDETDTPREAEDGGGEERAL